MGSVWSVKREVPQVTCAFAPSTAMSTGWFGRLLEMSATSRPEIRHFPVSATWAGTVTRTEVS